MNHMTIHLSSSYNMELKFASLLVAVVSWAKVSKIWYHICLAVVKLVVLNTNGADVQPELNMILLWQSRVFSCSQISQDKV